MIGLINNAGHPSLVGGSTGLVARSGYTWAGLFQFSAIRIRTGECGRRRHLICNEDLNRLVLSGLLVVES